MIIWENIDGGQKDMVFFLLKAIILKIGYLIEKEAS